jgi:hypothetical protein
VPAPDQLGRSISFIVHSLARTSRDSLLVRFIGLPPVLPVMVWIVSLLSLVHYIIIVVPEWELFCLHYRFSCFTLASFACTYGFHISKWTFLLGLQGDSVNKVCFPLFLFLESYAMCAVSWCQAFCSSVVLPTIGFALRVFQQWVPIFLCADDCYLLIVSHQIGGVKE